MYRTSLLVLPLFVFATAGFAARRVAHPSARAVVAAKFAAVNRHNVPAIVSLYAADAQINASDYCKPRRGQSEVQRLYQSLFKAYPDVVVNVRDYVAEGDRVAVVIKVIIRINGEVVEVPIADFFTVRDGRIVNDDGYFDVHGRPCSS